MTMIKIAGIMHHHQKHHRLEKIISIPLVNCQ